MAAFDVYKLWSALHLHFTTSYDYFQYNGKTKVSQKSFDMQRNKNIFYKLARKYDDIQIIDYFLANLLYCEKLWEEMLDTPEAVLNFKSYTKRKQSLFKIFCDDIQKLQYLCDINNRNFINLFDCKDSNAKHYPQIVVYAHHGEITVETYIILDILFKFTDSEKWVENLEDDKFWQSYKVRCDKYKPFMEKLINKTKYKLKLKELLTDITPL